MGVQDHTSKSNLFGGLFENQVDQRKNRVQLGERYSEWMSETEAEARRQMRKAQMRCCKTGVDSELDP